MDQFSERAAAAYCASIQPCCAKAQYAYDAAACTSALRQMLDEELLEPAGAGKATYDASAAGSCIAQLESAGCGASASDPEACERIFVGTLPPGAACQNDIECVPPPGGDVDCEKADGASAGTCVQEPRGKAGDACDGTCTESGSMRSCSIMSDGAGHARCYTNDGLFCDGTKCTALIPIGGACESEGCVDGAYCASGKCAAKAAAGGACDGSWDSCTSGNYCESTTNTCKAQKPSGAPCTGDGDECQGYCSEGGVCKAGGDVSAEECVGAMD